RWASIVGVYSPRNVADVHREEQHPSQTMQQDDQRHRDKQDFRGDVPPSQGFSRLPFIQDNYMDDTAYQPAGKPQNSRRNYPVHPGV
ncbi:MAG: hypothetical protein M3Z49_14545, partial [Bifidobacteriales bacterium]|nr:hypothetical protein [Bifidobacteriales bacterium]